MSKIEVDAITQQSGSTLTVGGGASKTVVADATTVTLGRCGGTVALASGATQSGFGRNGSVNWQTTIKTGDFTAVSGEGYFVNTTSGEIDVTLPSSPSVGDIVAVSDYAKTFNTNNCIMLRNSSNIEGAASNLTLDAQGLAMTFVYADATKGWKVVTAGRESDSTAQTFMVGTGGTITCCGDYKIHTFTGPGTFTVNSVGNATTVGDKVEYLVVAGGGGGGGGYQSGGGGGGGYRESPGTVAGGSYTVSPRGAAPAAAVTVTAQGYPIVVGGGGPGGPSTPSSGNYGQTGTQGNTSSGLGISSAGGGYGGAFHNGEAPGPARAIELGGDGGSGGGSGRSPATNPGGTGNTPSVNPVQGTNGGNTTTPYQAPFSGGGGGGALTPGGPGQGSCFGVGGNGATSAINGSSTARAGGGGSGSGSATPGAATGGPGGGGNGGWGNTSSGGTNAVAGTVNTGGGGGGTGYENQAGAAGGSGIVIIRYKFQ